VLGAANGKDGVGGTLDFSKAFGDLGELLPNAVSDAVELRLRLNNLLVRPLIGGIVTGATCVLSKP